MSSLSLNSLSSFGVLLGRCVFLYSCLSPRLAECNSALLLCSLSGEKWRLLFIWNRQRGGRGGGREERGWFTEEVGVPGDCCLPDVSLRAHDVMSLVTMFIKKILLYFSFNGVGEKICKFKKRALIFSHSFTSHLIENILNFIFLSLCLFYCSTNASNELTCIQVYGVRCVTVLRVVVEVTWSNAVNVFGQKNNEISVRPLIELIEMTIWRASEMTHLWSWLKIWTFFFEFYH